jgi:dihydrofolate reductase
MSESDSKTGQVIVDVSVSVDGFVAGPGVSVDRPMGAAGQRLHRWLGLDSGAPTEDDATASQQMFATTGAIVIGRRMFDVGIGTWGDDGAFGRPTFVVTHRARRDLVKGPTTFAFVTGGVAAALDRARTEACEQDVVIAGGAEIVQQALASGIVDELRLHVVPVLLGSGTRLFHELDAQVELTRTGIVSTPNATHLTFRVERA